MHIVTVGGSDAGISAALRARELDPSAEVTVVVADEYPNYSICGIPYYFSGDVKPWQSLAHRTRADLEATGMQLRLNTLATRIDASDRRLIVRHERGESTIAYDELIVGTGALPAFAGIEGLGELGPGDGVHIVHSMGDTFALDADLAQRNPRTALIIGAGYVGLEMAEGFRARGMQVVQLQRGPEVLSTLDPDLASTVHEELVAHGVDVYTNTTVKGVVKGDAGLIVHAERLGEPVSHTADLVLAVVGVRPNTTLLEHAGAHLGAGRAVVVDDRMQTGIPHVFAAGDDVTTHHRLLGTTYLPLGTTAHKQGRVAGENAIGGRARYTGSVGTQVVKVIDVVAARTGLREHEAAAAGYAPVTIQSVADDHKRHYPGAQPISMRITGDRNTGQLLGAQMVGRLGTETEKRIDTFATALFAGLCVGGRAPPRRKPTRCARSRSLSATRGPRVRAGRCAPHHPSTGPDANHRRSRHDAPSRAACHSGSRAAARPACTPHDDRRPRHARPEPAAPLGPSTPADTSSTSACSTSFRDVRSLHQTRGATHALPR